jgi:hypothetical protein
VVEVVKLLRYDSISRACDYYRELLSLLSTIYFTQAPPSGLLADSMHWQRNMLYVALEIEEAFRQLDLHPSSCLPSTPSNVVSIGPFMSSNSVHSTPTRRSRPHDSSPFDELRAMSPLDLRPFSPQTPTPTTHSIAPSPAPALLSYASCGDTFDAKSLPNLDRLLLVVSRGYDSVQRVLAQPMLQRPLEHAPTANTMTPKARRITPTVSQAVC